MTLPQPIRLGRLVSLFATACAPTMLCAEPAPKADAKERVPRSAKILKDDYFFEKAFATELLDAFEKITRAKNRRTFQTTGQFRKKPNLAEIIQRYGEPDLVVATKEFYIEGDDAKSFTVTAFFDRLGLSVYGKHRKNQSVNLVTLQHHDYSKEIRPKKGTFFYEISSTRNRIFFVDGEEVGVHVYTGRQEWKAFGDIPAGRYEAAGEADPYATITFDESSQGKLTYYYPNGGVQEMISLKGGKYDGPYRLVSEEGWPLQQATYENSRLHGKLERFYDNGSKKAEANYFHGRVHGPAVEYHPNGAVKMKMEYSYGKPMTALEEFDEAGNLIRSTKAPTPGGTPASAEKPG